MAEAKITTLLPTFNRASLLKRAIQSVLNQSYQGFVLYVFDNASTDNTAEVVASFNDPRIHYVRHKKNIGLFQNFAQSLSYVKTEYFSFLSDDDYLLPWFYETTLAAHKLAPEVGFVATHTIIANNNWKPIPGQKLSLSPHGYFSTDERTLNLLHIGVPLWTGIMYKSSLLAQVESITPDIGMIFDQDFTLRYAAYAPFILIGRAGAIFSKWEGSKSYQHSLEDFWPSYPNFIKSILKCSPITDTVKVQLNTSFYNMLKANVRKCWLKAVKKKNADEMISCKRVLEDLRDKKSKQLTFYAFLAKWLPPIWHGLVLAYETKLFLKTTFKLYLHQIINREAKINRSLLKKTLPNR